MIAGEPGLVSTDHFPEAGCGIARYVALCEGTFSANALAPAEPGGAGEIRSPEGETSVTSGGPPLPVSWTLSSEVPGRTAKFGPCASCAAPGGWTV